MSLLKNIFKIGFIKDILSPKIVTVTFQGKDQPALLYMPYGMFFKPSKKSIAGILADQGNESSLMAMVTDIENREELDDGEVALGIPAGKNRIYFKKDNSIIIQDGKITITLNASGGVEVANDNGNFSLLANGQFKANGFTVDP